MRKKEGEVIDVARSVYMKARRSNTICYRNSTLFRIAKAGDAKTWAGKGEPEEAGRSPIMKDVINFFFTW